MGKLPPPPCGAWTWTHRIAGPVGGASLMCFGLFALMGGWWLIACGPCAVVAAVVTALWMRVSGMADALARLNHDTLGRLRRKENPPPEDPS